MKIKHPTFVYLWLSLLLVACQQEAVEIINPPFEEAIDANSMVTTLIQKTTLKDGSFDNIMDGGSCTSIVLPVTVQVDNMELIISSESDFEIIEEIFDEFPDDEDKVTFSFPINVILADYTELLVSSEAELKAITMQCVENGDDDDIECVDFNYPLTVSVFNTINQVADVLTFINDMELYQFISFLGTGDLVGISFPIIVTTFDGMEFSANDNNELEQLIEANQDECDEDDDNDFDDDDPPGGDLISILLDGEWLISSFVIGGSDETDDFTGYTFTFNADGTALADNGGSQISGSWSHKTEGNGGEELSLSFGVVSPFDDLEDDWDVGTYDISEIKLMDEDTAMGSNRLITFSKQ